MRDSVDIANDAYQEDGMTLEEEMREWLKVAEADLERLKKGGAPTRFITNKEKLVKNLEMWR